MKITLYVRTFPIKDAPVALSLVPFPLGQKHTYTRDGKVYDAVCREMKVVVPEGSVIDAERKLLCWSSETGPVKSTVNEVYELVKGNMSGFSAGT